MALHGFVVGFVLVSFVVRHKFSQHAQCESGLTWRLVEFARARLRTFCVGLVFCPRVIWTSVSPQTISSSCILQDHGLHGASAGAIFVLTWSVCCVCCLVRRLFPDAYRLLRYWPGCSTKCAQVCVRVLLFVPTVVVGQHLPRLVISVEFEESVCGFQAKQVFCLTSQSVGAMHERGWQADTSVDVWSWVCCQAPAD